MLLKINIKLNPRIRIESSGKMKLLLSIIWITFFFSKGYNQRVSLPWYFVPTSVVKIDNAVEFYRENHNITIDEEGYAICYDKDGGVLFYTNGKHVWSSNHIEMPNSNKILEFTHASTTQQSIIYADENRKGIYNVLILNNFESNGELYLFSVDMALNNGFGDVVPGSQRKIGEDLTEQMFAIPHPCAGIWLLTHLRNSNYYKAFHISNNEVVSVVISEGTFFINDLGDGSNFIGSLYVNNKYQFVNLNGTQIEMGNFDPFSGEIRNSFVVVHKNKTYQSILYKGSFSSSGDKFYLPLKYNDSVFIRQYNLVDFDDININKNVFDLYVDSIGAVSLYDCILQNEKIFITIASERGGVSVINAPDSTGVNFDFVYMQYRFPINARVKSFPAPMATETKPLENFVDTSMHLCAVSEIKISSSFTFDSVFWSTGEQTVSIVPKLAGIYSAKVFKNGCEYKDSIEIVLDRTVERDTIYFCENEVFEYNGKLYDTTGIVIDTIINTEGCSIVKEINLIESEAISFFRNIPICEGNNYVAPNGEIYFAGDTFNTVIPSTSSCDTVVFNHLVELPLPKTTIDGQQVICFGMMTNLVAVGDYERYQWNTQDSVKSIQVGEGMFDVVVTDSFGCKGLATVTIIERPEWLVEVINSIEVEGTYFLQLVGDVGRIKEWKVIPNNDVFLLSEDRLLVDGNVAPGLYQLEFRDDIGCLTIANFEIEPKLEIETVQTNILDLRATRDENRKWEAKMPEGHVLEIAIIFDRWGNKVFETKSIDESWDGQFSGRALASGNYVYLIKMQDSTGNLKLKVGSILLLGGE